MDLSHEGDCNGRDRDITHVLQSAPEEAVAALVAAEKSRKSTHAPHFPGNSERTLSRKRQAWRKLAAQGFTTLPEFLRQKAEDEERKARLAALVAAHASAWPRSMQDTHIREEEEEESASGDEIIEMRAEEFNPKTTPIQVEDVENIRSKPTETESRFSSRERDRARRIHDPSDLRSSLEASPTPLEESEESSSCCETLSDDDEPDSESHPSKKMQHDLDDTQGIFARKLEELRRGIQLDNTGLALAQDNALGYLRDRTALRTAREQLIVMVDDKKMDGVLRGRILAMVGVLNLFLDEGLGYTWRRASLIVAKSQSHGVARARSIRHWLLNFLQTAELPHPKYRWTRSSVLEDEDISQEIQLELGERMKSGSITATDLVDVVASPKVQEQLKNAGIDKPSISERTAHRWLGKLGWRYGKQQNGMYVDGHEREDVVQYRDAFVQRFKQYERRFHLWDENGDELPRPRGFPVPEAAGRFRLVLVTHDESTFFQNDQRKIFWDRKGSSKAPRPKGEGQSLMISDFLTADWGRLRDDNRCAVLPASLHQPHSFLFQ